MSSSSTCIYFYTPEYNSGGVKMLYRHAGLLSKHGFQAYVLHAKKGHRFNSFEHNSPVSYLDDIRLTPENIIVMPEYLAAFYNPEKNPTGVVKFFKQRFSRQRYKYLACDLFNSPCKKVIYNQNAYYTFLDYPNTPNKWQLPYHRKDCLAVVCVSEDNYSYLGAAFPQKPLFRIVYSINPSLYFPSTKKKQIAYLTFKNKSDVTQVVNLLAIRNKLNGFTLVPVEGTEAEVAQAFNESAIMLNFGNVEGFGLPPAEAMLSKCVVIGYHGQAGKEFMGPDRCFPIENGAILSFVQTVEYVTGCLAGDPAYFDKMTDTARRSIMDTYSLEKEEQSVLKAWAEITRLAQGGE